MKFTFVADDYGPEAGVNQKIEEACEKSVIRSVTILACSNVPDTISEFAKSHGVMLGAHLYLTEYTPLTSQVKKIIRETGFVGKASLLSARMSGKLTASDIYAELDAQISLLLRSGIEIGFMDSHQNVHALPGVFPVFKRLVEKYHLESRLRPFAGMNFNGAIDIRTIWSNSYANIVGHQANSRVLVGCPGYEAEDINIPNALKLWDMFLVKIARLSVSEICVPCHPGTSPAEVKLYSSPAFVELLKQHHVEL